LLLQIPYVPRFLIRKISENELASACQPLYINIAPLDHLRVYVFPGPLAEEAAVDASDARHAYAVLGLTPPVTEDELRHRYKELVKRWHPDRFQYDPQGQAEASVRLRTINAAYEAVIESLTARRVKSRRSPSPKRPIRRRTLRPEHCPGTTLALLPLTVIIQSIGYTSRLSRSTPSLSPLIGQTGSFRVGFALSAV
jgi:hypothetical protein